MILNSYHIDDLSIKRFSLNSQIFKNIIIQMFLLIVTISVITFFTVSKEFSIGVALGGILAAINFILLIFVVKKIFFGEPKTQIIYAILFMIKLSAIGGVIFWLFTANPFNFSKVGFLSGITILFITITINGLLYGNKLSSEVN